jgi:superfamily II DNA or RNA helicase
MISAYTGFGKTVTSINLACSIGFKTLIIVHRVMLTKQWGESIANFCPTAKVQILTAQSKIDITAHFYIMNAINVSKMTRTFFKEIGTVIVDEAHLIMAETLSKSMQFIHPRYLIGLTATPYRTDGLDILLELYFGKYKIIRKLWRKHTAYVVHTGFTPTVEKNKQGRINWDVILKTQSEDEKRNELIIQILQLYKDRTFLVLVKRVEQGEHLVRRLKEEGETVTSLLGNNQVFEQSARILVGTNSKVGVGFDHPSLNALLLAADLEQYFIQYLGRCMRTEKVEPIIFDLVDNNPILKKHFDTRRKVYIEHGGMVKQFDMKQLL